MVHRFLAHSLLGRWAEFTCTIIYSDLEVTLYIIIKWNIHITNKFPYNFVRKQVKALNTRPHNFATIWSNGVNSGFINRFRKGIQSKVSQDIPRRSWSILALQEEVNVRSIPSWWFQLIYQLTKRDADTRNEYVSLKILRALQIIHWFSAEHKSFMIIWHLLLRRTQIDPKHQP